MCTRLGNLTLVSDRLNPTLSNRPWSDEQAASQGLGRPGKRAYLLRHSGLSLNAILVADHDRSWTEADIAERTAQLTRRIAGLWPCPKGTPQSLAPERQSDQARIQNQSPVPDVPVEEAPTDQGQPSHSGKYRALWAWLRAQDLDTIELSFAQVEHILDLPLPPSARTYPQHWYGYNGTALGRAIRDAGWKVSDVHLHDERVTFKRQDSGSGEDPSMGNPAEHMSGADQAEVETIPAPASSSRETGTRTGPAPGSVRVQQEPQPGPAAGDVDPSTLERAFHDAMVNVYRRAQAEAGYKASLFLSMISQRGGLETARTLLNAAKPSDGFTALWERERLDLTVEAVILQPRFDPLFTDEERNRAQDRLAQYGYKP